MTDLSNHGNHHKTNESADNTGNDSSTEKIESITEKNNNSMPPLQHSPTTEARQHARRVSERALQAKRASEKALQQMLRDAQSKFDRLNQEKQQVATENRHLHEKLVEAEKHIKPPPTTIFENSKENQEPRKNGQKTPSPTSSPQVAAVVQSPKDVAAIVQSPKEQEEELAKKVDDTPTSSPAAKSSVMEEKDVVEFKEGGKDEEQHDHADEIAVAPNDDDNEELLEEQLIDPDDVDDDEESTVTEELNRARDTFPNLFQEYCRMEADLEHTFEQNRQRARRIMHLEADLEDTLYTLEDYKQSDKALKKSLKEALRLLQPMQLHLETAEREKKEMKKQIKALKRQLKEYKRAAGDSVSVASQDTTRSSPVVGQETEKVTKVTEMPRPQDAITN